MVTFPNGETIEAHEGFSAVCCMNTYGTGANDKYTGRNRLDLATLDRFVYLNIPIDEGLEAAIVGVPDHESPECDVEEGGMFKDEKEIFNYVISLRGVMEDLKLRHSLSPRATIFSCALHRAGFGKMFIDDSCIWRGMPEDQIRKVQKKMSEEHGWEYS